MVAYLIVMCLLMLIAGIANIGDGDPLGAMLAFGLCAWGFFLLMQVA